jgi:hypothetical protein
VPMSEYRSIQYCSYLAPACGANTYMRLLRPKELNLNITLRTIDN